VHADKIRLALFKVTLLDEKRRIRVGFHYLCEALHVATSERYGNADSAVDAVSNRAGIFVSNVSFVGSTGEEAVAKLETRAGGFEGKEEGTGARLVFFRWEIKC
jgi:hypothetical protein